MKRLAVVAAVLLALTGCEKKPVDHKPVPPAPAPTAPAVEPEEDSPDFDCRKHGNRICGPAERKA